MIGFGIGPLGGTLVARIAERIDLLTVQQVMGFDDIPAWPDGRAERWPSGVDA